MYKQKTLDFIEAKKKGSITLLLLKINLSKMIAKEKTEVLMRATIWMQPENIKWENLYTKGHIL